MLKLARRVVSGLSRGRALRAAGRRRSSRRRCTWSPSAMCSRRRRWRSPLPALFVVISQLKINVTNAYAGSIAWSNFFSRLTHSHPGRVVWLVFNVTDRADADGARHFQDARARARPLFHRCRRLGQRTGRRSRHQQAARAQPAGIEFKRAHLYDINPVGVGAMLAAIVAGTAAFCGLFGATLQSLSSSWRWPSPL